MNRLKKCSALALTAALGLVVACQITITPDGDGGITGRINVANQVFKFTLGTDGTFQIQKEETVTHRGVVDIFDGTPDDRPGNGYVSLDPQDVSWTPLAPAKSQANAQVSLDGRATLHLKIGEANADDPSASDDPCAGGVDLGTIDMTLTNDGVMLSAPRLHVPAEALGWLMSGTFAICVELTADLDCVITIDELSVEFDEDDAAPATMNDLDLAVTGSGSVSPSGGKFATGERVTLMAFPSAGWTFDHWEGDASGTANPLTITMNGDFSVTAVFVEDDTPPNANFTVTATATGGGTVERSAATVESGRTVTLTARPDDGWTFDHWEGDLTGSTNPATITVTDDVQVTAVFVETDTPIGTFSVTVAATGSGSVDRSAATVTDGGSVTLTARPDDGWVFDHWEGDLAGSTNPATVTVTGNISVTAVFVEADSGWIESPIEYRQVLDVLVYVEDVDNYLTEHPHGIGQPTVSRDGSIVAFKSWVDGWRTSDTSNVHTYVIRPDGTSLTDLTPFMPGDHEPRYTFELTLNEDGSRLFARFGDTSIYYCQLSGPTWHRATTKDPNYMGGHKLYTINGAGTRLFFKHIAPYNGTITPQGIFYADVGGAPVQLMEVTQMPPPGATLINMVDIVGNDMGDTVLFTWNEDYYAGDSTGLWKVTVGSAPVRVNGDLFSYLYGYQSNLMPSRIVTDDGDTALVQWGLGDDYGLDIVDMNAGTRTELIRGTGLNRTSSIALSGDGNVVRYGYRYATSARHDLSTGDRRETMSYYTNFTTWGTELSDLTYDGRFQFNTDKEYSRIYRMDFEPDDLAYAKAPRIGKIYLTSDTLKNPTETGVAIKAEVTDAQGAGNINDVRMITLVDGLEEYYADVLSFSSSHLYDDGTHGDETAGDGVYTMDGFRTIPGHPFYSEVPLPYPVGLRIVARDKDGNYSYADTAITVTN